MCMQVLFLIVSPLPVCVVDVLGSACLEFMVCVWGGGTGCLGLMNIAVCLITVIVCTLAAAGISIIVKKQLGEERVSSIVQLSPLSREVKVGIQGRSLNTASETETKEERLQACSPCLVQLSFLYNSIPLAQCERPVCALWVCPVP